MAAALPVYSNGNGNGMPGNGGSFLSPKPDPQMDMMMQMAKAISDMNGRLDIVLGPPSGDYFKDGGVAPFHPNIATPVQQSPSITVPLTEPKIFTHAIAADPARDRIFVYTGNAFYITAPMLAIVLAQYGGVGTVLANADQSQMAINSYLQNYATCPSKIKITPQVVGALEVAFFQNHPTHNNIISVPYPLGVFVENTQFQANIVDLPYGFKLGADVLFSVPVPANTTTTILFEMQPTGVVMRNK